MSVIKKYPSSAIPEVIVADDGKVLTNVGGVMSWEEPTGGSGSGASASYTHTLTALDASGKSISLPFDITTDNFVDLDIVGGSSPALGEDFDFNYSLNLLVWSGLGLDGLLAEGDIIVLTYLS